MKKETLFTRLNNFIVRLNKPAYISIVLFYAVLLIILSIVLFPKKSFVLTPDYPHQIEEKNVEVEIRINPTRRVDSNDEIITNYGVVAYIDGKTVNGVREKFDISNFQMSNLLTTDKIYYFTEHNDNKTPISHSYSLYSSTKLQIPEEFYVRVKYTEDEEEKTLTYFEEMLEIGNKRKYSNYNLIIDEEKHADKERKTQVKIDFYGKEENEDFILRTMIEVVDITKHFHLDMQSWILTEDGKLLHGSGVYGFNGRSYYQTSHLIDLKLKPKAIYSHLVYYEEGKDPQYIYYKENLKNLPESINDITENVTPPQTNNLELTEYIIIIAIGVVIILFAIKIINDNRSKNKVINEKNIDKVSK